MQQPVARGGARGLQARRLRDRRGHERPRGSAPAVAAAAAVPIGGIGVRRGPGGRVPVPVGEGEEAAVGDEQPEAARVGERRRLPLGQHRVSRFRGLSPRRRRGLSLRVLPRPLLLQGAVHAPAEERVEVAGDVGVGGDGARRQEVGEAARGRAGVGAAVPRPLLLRGRTRPLPPPPRARRQPLDGRQGEVAVREQRRRRPRRGGGGGGGAVAPRPLAAAVAGPRRGGPEHPRGGDDAARQRRRQPPREVVGAAQARVLGRVDAQEEQGRAGGQGRRRRRRRRRGRGRGRGRGRRREELGVDGVVEVRDVPRGGHRRGVDPPVRAAAPRPGAPLPRRRRRRRRPPPCGRKLREVVLRRAAPRDVEAVVVAPDVEDGGLGDARGALEALEQLAVEAPLGARLAGAAVDGLGVREVARDEQRDRDARRPGGRRRRRRRGRERPPGRRDDRGGPGDRVRRGRPLGGERGRGGARPLAEVEVGELEEDRREGRRCRSRCFGSDDQRGL